MNLQDLSIEQLQQIVDGAPDGAEYYDPSINGYVRCAGFDAIKLSDIRAELLSRPKFKVGDRVVLDVAVPHLKNHKLIKITADDIGKPYTNNYKHASDEEIAAGHRIEQPMVDLELKAPEPKLHWFLVGYSFKSKYGSDGTGNLKVGRINKDLRESDLVDIRNSILAMHSSFESVAILAISPLSYMTKTEFYQQPDSEEL